MSKGTTAAELLAGIRAGWRATRDAAEEKRQREPPASFACFASENAELDLNGTGKNTDCRCYETAAQMEERKKAHETVQTNGMGGR